MREFEFNLPMEELEKRTNKDYLMTKKMLKADAAEYSELAQGDKDALKHLVKAAYILEKINMQIDCHHNLEFKEFLEKEISKGSKQAELTKILFDAQKGMNAIDTMSNKINLAKGITELPGKGVYPEDLSKEEFHTILTEMINEGKTEEVKKILTQRSVVERNGDELVGIDYIDKFKEDFAKMADEIEKAAETSTNADFNEYLRLQAKALREADPMLDAYADKKWAALQDTPLEFTITRENYEDEMTGTIAENKDLSELLEQNGIKATPKDFLGGRVGIVNKKGTDALMAIKKYLPTLAQNMPFSDEYEQNINPDQDAKQTMVDVDLVAVTGDVGAYRGGITLAENLPNDDKLSLTIGGGRRNVYHRQIRFISDMKKLQERLDAILDKEQHKYYLDEADHWFTIGHENAHSLGPKKACETLGKYRNIIEENKADMGSLAFVDLLTELGMYTEEQRRQIIVTTIADNFLKSKPTLSQAHRVRTVMQNKYFAERGAYEIIDEKIHVNIDKVVPIAKEMLSEIVRIQIEGDFDKAEKYVLDNFIWTDNMELIAQKLQKINKTLNGRTESELAEKLLNE
ncbi:mutT/NUDIX family protein [Fusobacterium sp. CAG:439]|nr:mutT/NUDIX family protein [Fusobacterium sp. CAG:439]